jgi:hypothetical protein
MRLSRFTIVLLFGAVGSALWLFLAARYVAVQIGWENLFFLLPHELGAFLAGVFMPLAFLWLALCHRCPGPSDRRCQYHCSAP